MIQGAKNDPIDADADVTHFWYLHILANKYGTFNSYAGTKINGFFSLNRTALWAWGYMPITFSFVAAYWIQMMPTAEAPTKYYKTQIQIQTLNTIQMMPTPQRHQQNVTKHKYKWFQHQGDTSKILQKIPVVNTYGGKHHDHILRNILQHIDFSLHTWFKTK